MSGQVPYHDFMIIGGPAYFYLLAVVFKIAGPFLIFERILNVLFLSGIAFFVHQIALQLVPKRWAFLSFVISLAMLGSYPHFPGPQPCAVFLALMSVFLFLKSGRVVFACGVLTGLSIVVRQDVGACAFAAQLLFLLKDRRDGLKAYFLGGAAILLPVGAYIFIQVPFDRLVFAFWDYPLHVYPRFAARTLPIEEGTLADKLMLLMPFVIYPASLLLWFKKRSEKSSYPVLFLVLFGLLNMNQARLRPDPWHFLSTWMACSILAAVLAERIWKKRVFLWRFMLIGLGVIFLGLPLIIKGLVLFDSRTLPSSLEKGRGIRFLSDSYGTPEAPAEFLNYESAVKYIVENTQPGEKIFVGSTRHDHIRSADPLFYFLAGRPSAVRDNEMHRGYFNTQKAQEEAVAEIEKNHVRFIVLREALDGGTAGGSSVLDEYIRSNYKPTVSFGPEHIYEVI